MGPAERSRGVRRLICTAGLLVGCSGGPAPTHIGECGRLSTPHEVESCRYDMLQPVVSGPRLDADALDDGLKEIADDTSRDLVLLRLAIAAPKHAGTLCKRVRTAGASEKCRQVLGRPHLGTERRAPKPPPTAPSP